MPNLTQPLSRECKTRFRRPPKPIKRGNYYLIELTQGKWAKVCACHLHLVSGYVWCSIAGYARTYGRLHHTGEHMHRMILGLSRSDSRKADHINRDRSDNRCCNLRAVTARENSINRSLGRRNKSGFRGVLSVGRLGKWEAKIGFHRKSHYIGVFDRKEDAARAYDKKATEFFGEFAVLNFPNK